MIDQIVIGVCGLSSVFLSQSASNNLQRYACLFGIVAQPFWFYSAYTAEQWGILVLAFIYTAGWSQGVYNFWIKPRRLSLITE